ncbi:MAG TPA: amidase [Candidatus Binatia bacterium]|nr:amidase [Candidatus Binatia bacterium]
MPGSDAPGFTPALELIAALRAREASPVELLEAVLTAITEAQPRLNAFTVLLEAEARAQAGESERRILAGEGRPLEGLPIPIKDNVLVAGAPLSDGSRMTPELPMTMDTELVARLRRAGAVLVGKTNLPEFGTISTTENLRFGATRNPWDPSRTAGGSSGGSAAAVAAGLVPAAHGNDGGGSLRIPAACCGLFALKPSRGRIPRGPLPGNDPALLVVDGFLTRSVADNALLLDAVSGAALGDPLGTPPPERSFSAEVVADPGRLRIGWTVTPPAGFPVDRECVRAVDAAVRLAANLGHEVEPFTPDWQSEAMLEDFLDIWAAEIGATMDFYASLGGDPGLAEPHNRALRERARGLDSAELTLKLSRLQLLARRVLAAHERYELILTPTLARPPVPLGWHFPDASGQDPLVVLRRAAEFSPFTAIANLTGQPAVSLPLHWSGDLPIGVMALGRPYGEAALLRFSAQMEAARPWAGRRPPAAPPAGVPAGGASAPSSSQA